MSERYTYVQTDFAHNMLADVINGTLVWITDNLLPRARYSIISTYDKMVERIKTLAEEDPNVPPLPAINLDPQFPHIEEGTPLWRIMNTSTLSNITRMFEPILQTDDLMIVPIFVPLVMPLEVTMWFPSVYEYLDTAVKINHYFGNENRYVRPQVFPTFIIIPDKLKAIEYVNPYENKDYIIDLSSVSSSQLIKSLGKEYLCFDCVLTPTYKFTGESDAAEKYGGDSLADWKLSFTMEMNIQLPLWFVYYCDYKIEHVDIDIIVSKGVASTDNMVRPDYDVIVNACDNTMYEFYNRYIHIVENNVDELTLDISEFYDSDKIVKFYSYGGVIPNNLYEIDEVNKTVHFSIPFKKNDAIDMFVYRKL